jgi:multiple sugar transport system substrate-binding protein/raffinose/stachyose/melibiose transport system substrate-binding protein
LIALVAAQCASPEEVPAEPAEVAEPVELTYVSGMVYTSDTLYNEVERELIDQFETAHPHIEISHGVAGDFPGEYLADVQPPDLIADTYFSLPFIDQGLVLDVSDIWLRPEMENAYPASFKALGAWDGKQYYLPIFYAWTAVYYNKEVFNRYNLTPPTTWDEFITVSDTLMSNGITPIALGTHNYDPVGAFYWVDYLNLRLNGPEFHAEFVRGQHPYEDSRIVDVFETWKYLFDNGYFSEKARSMRLADSLNEVLEEKAGMILTSSIDVGQLPDKLQSKLDFFPFPVIDPEVPIGEVGITFGYVIPADAQHPEEAIEFLAYAASVEGQTAQAQQFSPNAGVLPVNLEVDAADLSPTTRQGLELIRKADHVGQPYISSWVPGALWNAAYSVFSKFFRNQDNLETVLNEMEKTRQETFE